MDANQTRNLAARAGRWSAHHRRKAILGWLAFVILAVFVGRSVGTKTLEADQSGVGESGRADRTQADAFPKRAEENTPSRSGPRRTCSCRAAARRRATRASRPP